MERAGNFTLKRTHAFCLQGHNNQFIWLSLNNNLQAQRSQIEQQQTTQNHQQSIFLPQQQQSFLLPVQQRQQESIILSQNQQSLFLAQQQQPILLPQQQQRGRIILPQQPMFLGRQSQQPLLPRIPPPGLPLSRLPSPELSQSRLPPQGLSQTRLSQPRLSQPKQSQPRLPQPGLLQPRLQPRRLSQPRLPPLGLTPLPLPPAQLPLTQPPPSQVPQSQLAPSQLQTSRLTTPRIPVPGLIPPQLPPPRLPHTTSIASSHLQQPLLFMQQPLATQSLLFLRQTNEQQPLILLQQPQEQQDPILVLQPPQHQQECLMLQPQIEKKVDFIPTGRGRPTSLKASTSNSISNGVYKIEDDQPIKEEHPLTQKNDVEFQETISSSQAPLFNSQDTSAEFEESGNFNEIKAHDVNKEDSRDIIDPEYMQDNYRSSEVSPLKSVYLRVKSNKDLGLKEEIMSDAHENTTSDIHDKNQCTEVQGIDDVSLEMRYRTYKKLRHIKVKSKRRTRTYTHTCEICGTSFSQENQLTEHMTKHSKVEDKKVVEPKQFYCDNCRYKSITLSEIRRHIQIKHNENYTYICSICQECFKGRMEFCNHAKKHKLDPWLCDICENVFESRPALYRHKNEMHQQNLGRLQCDKCFKKFKNMNNLESHVFLHMAIYVCDECGKVCANRDYLTRHLYTHVDEKFHPCHMCKKKFKLIFSLHVHTLTHLGKKPYVCDVCNKSFTQRTPMMLHRRTQHPEVKDLPLPMPVKVAKLTRKEQNRIAQSENEESDASDESDETDSYDESEESDDD